MEKLSEDNPMSYKNIVISSGHGKYIRGASGVLDEVDEARKVVEKLANDLRDRGVNVKTFHDDTSHDQNTNLHTIVNYHNAQSRDLDVSVHFNAYVETTKPMGTETLYVSQSGLASNVSSAIAACGFINRGPKKRTDLYFLNNTEMPAILIETCFVDSTADADIYHREFEDICDAIADVLGGKEGVETPELPDAPTLPNPRPPEQEPAKVDITIAVEGDVEITVNGETINVHGR
jgi:N-acetylmuramoyl-L-alanine amidase